MPPRFLLSAITQYDDRLILEFDTKADAVEFANENIRTGYYVRVFVSEIVASSENGEILSY